MTNLEIENAYMGTDQVDKIYLGTDVVWEPQNDPCSGLSGESLCNCQGKYWWDDACHDEPEPPKLKLTFVFPTDGQVKLFDSQHGLNVQDITLGGSSIMSDVDYEGYFSYDPSVYAGPQDVYYYYDIYNNYIIGYQFYNLPNLVAIDIPGSIYSVGNYAFAGEAATPSNVTSITLNEGIERLEGRAFEEIRNVSAITIPQSINYIGTNCFYNFGVYTPVVYTFLNDVPPTFQMGEIRDLGQGNILIMVPCNSKDAYNQATNNIYDGRFVCTYDELMEKTPLTFEITSVGTAATGSIGIRLSGDTSASNRRPLRYYLNHEGTETSGDLRLRETASSSAITSLITGLTVGDKIEFWGYQNQSGMSVNASAFEYFVTTAGLTAKVYGNVNSLLFLGSWYHDTQQPVPQTAETAAFAFYKLFHSKTGFTFGAPDELQHIVLPVPANGLQSHIYRDMFAGCTSLITAPALPATTLATYCYYNMFSNCTSLTTAPSILPATTLASYCYGNMFSNCTSLTTAPELPATTLTNSCYAYMFQGCTSLTAAPELPATTLTSGSYSDMFSGCTSLNYIKCLATNIGSSWFPYTSNWVSGVASSGTFVKHPNMSSWTTGTNGIPTNWTVQDAVI